MTKYDENKVSRRVFLVTGAAAAAGLAFRLHHRVIPVQAAGTAVSKNVKVVQFNDMGKRTGVVSIPMVVKSEADWKQQLPKQSFDILRHADTEYPYTGKYWNLHDKGIYHCAGCDLALFNSDTKFESHTGWPSFWQPLAAENVHENTDRTLGMDRTEVRCTLCDGHLGHVFNDGPDPTGLRYCMNSGALKFMKIG